MKGKWMKLATRLIISGQGKTKSKCKVLIEEKIDEIS
jgi:hypothetical protein